MPKRLANTNHQQNLIRYLLLLALAALAVPLIVASARQQSLSVATTSNAQQQQRPRRVGSDSTTTKRPTPGTSAPAPNTAASGEEVDEGDVVRVETQLVSVPAVVMDTSGRPIAGLRADNFLLYEDGRPQQIANFGTTDAPFEVALLLDTSGSTRADVALIRGAANAFIDSLRAGDRVAIISYNTSQYDRAGLATVDVMAELTSNRKALREAIGDIGSSNGTPFYDSLERIVSEVFREPPGDEVRGRRAVVALTDGVDSSSNREYAEVSAKLLSA